MRRQVDASEPTIAYRIQQPGQIGDIGQYQHRHQERRFPFPQKDVQQRQRRGHQLLHRRDDRLRHRHRQRLLTQPQRALHSLQGHHHIHTDAVAAQRLPPHSRDIQGKQRERFPRGQLAVGVHRQPLQVLCHKQGDWRRQATRHNKQQPETDRLLLKLQALLHHDKVRLADRRGG